MTTADSRLAGADACLATLAALAGPAIDPLHAPVLAIVPAAGTGSRFGAVLPKQYLPLCGQPVLAHALRAFLAARRVGSSAPLLSAVVLVLAPDDPWWEQAMAGSPLLQDPRLVVLPAGGATRRDSVLAGLRAALGHFSAMSWAMVHDAARPGLSPQDVEGLHAAVLAHAPAGGTRSAGLQGGLLALPVADTLKRAQDGAVPVARVSATVSREGLWQAQTPQMFPAGSLADALRDHAAVTDESSAMEAAGAQPLLVRGSPSNFKITWPEDLSLMENLLRSRS